MTTEQGAQTLSVGQLLIQMPSWDFYHHMLDGSYLFYLLVVLLQRPPDQQFV